MQTKQNYMSRLDWWRRGESKQIVVLKTRNLLIFRDAQNAKNSKNAANWNVSGTQPQAARTSRWSTCLSLLRTGLACCRQIVLIKRLPNQGLDYGLAADV